MNDCAIRLPMSGSNSITITTWNECRSSFTSIWSAFYVRQNPTLSAFIMTRDAILLLASHIIEDRHPTLRRCCRSRVHSKMRFGPPPPRIPHPPQNASRYYNGQDVLSRWHIIDLTVLSFKIRSVDNDIYLERTVRSVTCRHYCDPIGMVDKRIKNSQIKYNGS